MQQLSPPAKLHHTPVWLSDWDRNVKPLAHQDTRKNTVLCGALTVVRRGKASKPRS
ncbi:hypothetical protein CSUI_008137 [Cystoisospora suis]|uniref:Uncharacterized protein n=1 Tax=Cystoisospora suis TaxID=483139 RepID=A0A2C6KNS7_9APIC|nr:hypothetical protein CSUI_008137 [Cystoisospora suis]